MNMACRLLVLLILIYETKCHTVNVTTETSYPSCVGSNLTSSYVYGSYPAGEENQYSVTVYWPIKTGKNFVISFDSEAHIELDQDISSFFVVTKVSNSQEDNFFVITLFGDSSKILKFKVKGPINGKVPYFKRVVVDELELCTYPVVGALDNMVKDSRIARLLRSSPRDGGCGRRKKENKERTVTATVKPGDWPWHVALFRVQDYTSKYICGGTLISRFFVLTAAQCVILNGIPVVPDILTVMLGEHTLSDIGEVYSQNRKVYSIKVHEEYGKPHRMDNDIALLKLMNTAIYTESVQPACIWSSNEHYQILAPNTKGTVVGWGSNATYDSTELKQVELPIISKTTCNEAKSHLYEELLQNGRKFCAGYSYRVVLYDTTQDKVPCQIPCDEDKGSAFVVFVPGALNDDSSSTGSWHVRGIVSTTIPFEDTIIPNSHQYVIFTDLSNYGDWIRANTIVNECEKI